MPCQTSPRSAAKRGNLFGAPTDSVYAQRGGSPLLPPPVALRIRPVGRKAHDLMKLSRISRPCFVAAVGGPVAIALAFGGVLAAESAKATGTISVAVNAGSGLGTIPSTANGVNTAVFDGHLNDASAASALTNAGVDALRYPGGSTSDVYDWQNNSVVSGQSYANPSNDFDDFMGIANKVGAAPIITVNYGSGTAAEAAAWVKYADVTKNYGAKYCELGNEVYGDGTYGTSWDNKIIYKCVNSV